MSKLDKTDRRQQPRHLAALLLVEEEGEIKLDHLGTGEEKAGRLVVQHPVEIIKQRVKCGGQDRVQVGVPQENCEGFTEILKS